MMKSNSLIKIQIRRNHCVLSHKNDLEPLHVFKDFPLFMGCVEHDPSADLKSEMYWWISKETGLIQLNPLISLDVLYAQSHGSGSVGKLWDLHHAAFANFIYSYSPNNILELGGAHGILSRFYGGMSGAKWTILEPNPSPAEGVSAKFIKGFFDETFVYREPFDAIIHSHVFEHMYEPDVFMRHLAGFMDNGKHLIFSLPNMQVMLERKYTNCINFEHTVFLAEPYVEYLLARHGFRLLEKEYFMEDHSIFYAAVRDNSITPIELPAGLHQKNKALYQDYVHCHEQLIADINQKIAVTEVPIYLFGAHVFAQYLIAFGLDTTRIVSILDNDLKKQGKRLYGTSLSVASPTVLKDVETPVVILKAGVYNDEIRQDILDNINPNTRFL